MVPSELPEESELDVSLHEQCNVDPQDWTFHKMLMNSNEREVWEQEHAEEVRSLAMLIKLLPQASNSAVTFREQNLLWVVFRAKHPRPLQRAQTAAGETSAEVKSIVGS